FVANVASSACDPGTNACAALRPGGGPGSRRSLGTWMGFVVSVTGLKKRRWRDGRRCCGVSGEPAKHLLDFVDGEPRRDVEHDLLAHRLRARLVPRLRHAACPHLEQSQ